MLNRGFTLIEVLVTLVILTFGLLGIAGLMAKGQRASFEAFQRQQALSIASDMAERIRGNRKQAAAYASAAPVSTPVGQGSQYNDLLSASITDCGTYTCTPAQLAAYDIALWDGLLVGYSESQVTGGAKVGGIINARGCIIQAPDPPGAVVCPAPPSPSVSFTRTMRISVAWEGNEETVAPTTSTCGQGVYTTETKRRVAVLDIMVLQSCP
jgi:type IV pilus assembly protein PilV